MTGVATTQPACVVAISHRCTPRSTRVTALQPITNQQPEGDTTP